HAQLPKKRNRRLTVGQGDLSWSGPAAGMANAVSSAMHRLPASIFAGVAAALLGGPFLVVALPPATAFAFAAIWGVVFGLIAAALHDQASVGGALVLGIVIALAADIVDFAFVPASVSAATSFLAHVAFGATFVLAPLVFRA